MNKDVEVEDGEIALENEFGDIVIIPKKYVLEVEGMVEDGCHTCIDSLVDTLPKMADKAKEGTVIPDTDPVKKVRDGRAIASPLRKRLKYKPKKAPDGITRTADVLLEGNDSPSTVLMSSHGEYSPPDANGKFVAFPTIFPKDSKNQTSKREDWITANNSDDAYELAKERSEVLYYDTQEEADNVAKGSWKKPKPIDLNVNEILKEDKRKKEEENKPKEEKVPKELLDKITKGVAKKEEEKEAPTYETKVSKGDLQLESDKLYRRGYDDEKFKDVQKILIDKGFMSKINDKGKDNIDGKFGDISYKSIRAYQKSKGLKVDGVIGENTLTALKEDNLYAGMEVKDEQEGSGTLTDNNLNPEEKRVDEKYNKVPEKTSFQNILKEVEVETQKRHEKENPNLEIEEYRIKTEVPKKSMVSEATDWAVGNLKEKIINPLKSLHNPILPESLRYSPELSTTNQYDKTENTSKYLLDNKSIGDIRQEKNISFLQVSKNKYTGNTVLPEKLKERVVNSIYPQGYKPEIDKEAEGIKRVKFVERLLSEDSRDKQVKRLPGKKGDRREDIFRMYGGLPQKYDTFTVSSFKAGKNSDTNLTFKDPEDLKRYVYMAATQTDLFKKLASGKITPDSIKASNASGAKGGDKIHKASFRDDNNVMWNATFGIGYDKSGAPYLSFYDNWDLKGKDDNAITKNFGGSPIEIYDRIPLNDALIKQMSKFNFSPRSNNASDGVGVEDNESGILNLMKEVDNNPELKKTMMQLTEQLKKRYK